MNDLSGCSILAVDDTKLNLDLLFGLLGNQYNLSVALNGESALNYLKENPADLILLDIMMPGMDGITVLRMLKENDATRDIPVLVLTAISDSDQKSLCFSLGAVDYIQKPFDVDELQARVRTHLSLAVTKHQLEQHNRNLQIQVEERTKEILATQQATIESMAALAEYRDPETGMHINRVKGYVKILATELAKHKAYKSQLSTAMINLIVQSAPLHDIGKVAIADNILLKPGKLTDEEFEEMKRHAEYGAQAIASVQRKLGPLPFLDVAKDIANFHHEKWNGTGYPEGLKGLEIPLSARIMSISDVYDALICRRVYKPPFAHSKAIKIIEEERDKSFDPDIVDVFTQVSGKFRDLALELSDSEEQREQLNK